MPEASSAKILAMRADIAFRPSSHWPLAGDNYDERCASTRMSG
jgi:hypothetical protein